MEGGVSFSRARVEATCFSPAQLPAADVPEIVMAGRSNVGKSSLINALLNAKLAHVGGTPGKTRSVNFYRAECVIKGGGESGESGETGETGETGEGQSPSLPAPIPFRIVDLPGYGYASRSKDERNDWLRLVSAYMERRAKEPGAGGFVCHLADFRHGLLPNDRELQEWLNGYKMPILVVFTKADKMPKGKWRGLVEQYVRDGLFSLDVPIVTSSEKRAGLDRLRSFIAKFLTTPASQGGSRTHSGRDIITSGL